MPTKSTRPTPEQVLLDDIIALIESSDLPPWRKPWTSRSGEHRNPTNGTIYTGSNPLLLELGLLMRGSSIPLWCTAKQAKDKGWCPQKGSRSVRIICPQLISKEQTDSDGKTVVDTNGEAVIVSFSRFKVMPVFNFSDLKGMTDEGQASLDAFIQLHTGNTPEVSTSERLTAAEDHLEQWEVPVVFGGAVACYSPAMDRISMPMPEDFITRETYCSTWLHEQAHSTGHHTRLDRPINNRFGSPGYAREELVAELGSVLACYRLSIGYELATHAAYMQSWASGLKEGGIKELYAILSEARQAADLIAPVSTDVDDAPLPEPEVDEQDWLDPSCLALV
jgi:antirestriction protein ArdC